MGRAWRWRRRKTQVFQAEDRGRNQRGQGGTETPPEQQTVVTSLFFPRSEEE